MPEYAAPDWQHLAAELSDVGADAVRRGLVLASGGNLSARVPGTDDFIVTGAGTWLDRLTVDQFALVTSSGEVKEGLSPSSEWKLHQRTYVTSPKVNSVIHVHPQYAVLLDALGHQVRLFTLDHAYYVKSVGRTPFFPNGSDELADSAAEQTREHPCVVMAHHGCSSVGDTIEMAYRRALNLEEAATATFRALQLGDTDSCFPPDQWQALHHQ